jgi:hypothetical protein
MDKKAPRRGGETDVESGPGALCPEAQADGVPCTEIGRDCEQCEKALRQTPPGKGKRTS